MPDHTEAVNTETSTTFEHLGNVAGEHLTAREAAAVFALRYWTPGRAVSLYELVPGNPLAVEFQVRNCYGWYKLTDAKGGAG